MVLWQLNGSISDVGGHPGNGLPDRDNRDSTVGERRFVKADWAHCRRAPHNAHTGSCADFSAADVPGVEQKNGPR